MAVSRHLPMLLRRPQPRFVDGIVHVSCDSGHSLTQTPYVHEIAYTCTSFGSHVVSASQGVEISNTPTCHPVSCGVPPSVLNAIVDRTTAVTTWSSSDDCTDSAATLCSNLQCVAISCSGGSFVPDGLYGFKLGQCHAHDRRIHNQLLAVTNLTLVSVHAERLDQQ